MRPILPVLTAALALSACAYNPELGRQQMTIVNDDSLTQAGEQAWNQALAKSKVSTDRRANARVRAVGQRVVDAAGLGQQPWDYAVFENTAPNAFVLPGGHVGVTTGLLTIVDNDDQLAAVIGHETGHVIAHHAAERQSQTVASSLLLGVLGAATGGDTARAISSYGGDAAKYGFLLPFSRKQELEADRLGVDFMQRAGYRPREAVVLWLHMQAQGGSSAPQFTSTHPSDATRIAALENYIAQRGW
ncbi:Zn-dependent protease with chaperone function [Caulobacter sp. Root1455]|jgi:predicted Zn-dependent protease|uniref:M48 family metallopeptidase n=1 Tax=Caulobacter sp. Root1455 TaxID=1736465 RepID=UPI0006F666AA|nr:M48 family metallopeptidase [Caulobacter sp. Root1455]KQY99020.1 Zn-dependent protease with chaperone function [Caulobacter sp. Root1455]